MNTLSNFMPRIAAAVSLLSCLIVVGCGPSGPVKITVNGTITYKGKKLPSGIVTFTGDNGFYAAASVQNDGTFIMTDVVPGEVKVGVMESPQGSGSSSGKGDAGPTAASVDLPQKYRDPNTSGLTYTIKPDQKGITIALE